MDLITGIISLVILLGSLSRILIPLIQGRPQTFGFSTTFAFFLGLLGGIMSLAKDWSWWWTVPTGLVGICYLQQRKPILAGQKLFFARSETLSLLDPDIYSPPRITL